MMDRKNTSLISLYFSFLLMSSITPSFSIAGSLSQGQQLKHGQLLLSDSGSFALGFFSPNYNYSYYIGIWYNLDDQTYPHPVWIANRNTPIFDDSAILSINDEGSLEIKYGKGNSNTMPLYTVESATKTIATLQDDGNFVLRANGNSSSNNSVLWQSFDYPTDTLLPGMKLGFNRQKGWNWSLRSWRNHNLPALGSFTFGIDPNNTKQLVIWWLGKIYWRSGEWQEKDGSFKLSPELSITYEVDYNRRFFYRVPGSNEFYSNERYPNIRTLVDYNFHYSSTGDEVYFSFSVNKTQLYLGPTQQVPRLTLSYEGDVSKGVNETAVSCSRSGPFHLDQLDAGCLEEWLPKCRSFDSPDFYSNIGAMLGEGFKFEEGDNLTQYDCQAKCLKNCTCVAYASTDEFYETGCEIWSTGASFNATTNLDEKGRNIYILYYQNKSYEIRSQIASIVVGVLTALALCYFCYVFWRKCKRKVEQILKRTMLIREIGGRTAASIVYDIAKRQREDVMTSDEIQIFSFKSIAKATKNFSAANKLGEGGFGPVYKGKTHDGQEIAIKRLSKKSGQGLAEFKNEAKLIAKLQHTNLVRLLGFCVQRDERMLIYEYMPNKSLDFYLFDPEKRNMLNWTKRFNIIEGIAQGLIYLHEYSRLTVIHRDLKASNILLDEEMNPKISDFGMAKIFRLRGIEENTSRIVGTYGYMSPEYAMNGIVSFKTDIFSFGVLVLEIVSGKKNNSRHQSDYPLNLTGLAWQLWNEGRGEKIIDPLLLESGSVDEVLRCIQVALLCVQDRAADRPSMPEVISMLSNENVLLSTPKQPAFYIDVVEEVLNGLEKEKICSVNEVTISKMDAR